jgi:hypothetical protein
LKMFKKEKVKRFVYERILTCFEITLKMVWNNGPQFANDVILKFMKKLAIKHHMTNTYKPNINFFECKNKMIFGIFQSLEFDYYYFFKSSNYYTWFK